MEVSEGTFGAAYGRDGDGRRKGACVKSVLFAATPTGGWIFWRCVPVGTKRAEGGASGEWRRGLAPGGGGVHLSRAARGRRGHGDGLHSTREAFRGR